MITTEQEARAAVAKVGPDAVRVVDLIASAVYGQPAEWTPATILYAARIYEAQGRPWKCAQLFRAYAEWAAARGAAR